MAIIMDVGRPWWNCIAKERLERLEYVISVLSVGEFEECDGAVSAQTYGVGAIRRGVERYFQQFDSDENRSKVSEISRSGDLKMASTERYCGFFKIRSCREDSGKFYD